METWSQGQVIFALVGAVVLLILDVLLSIVLVTVGSLTRVALHRLGSEPDSRVAFLAEMRELSSPHRTATALARQLCLLGAVLLIVLALHGAGWRYPAVSGVVIGALGGVVLLELFLARLLAVWDPRLAARRAAFVVRPAYVLLYPIVRPLQLLLNRINSIQLISDEEREDEQEEEVEAFIEAGEREGLLEANEGEMVRSIVDLDETRVREIMTPRTNIVAVTEETSLADARATILHVGHSRLPVYRGTIDNIVGVLHERDLLRAWAEGRGEQRVGGHLREAIFVPETSSVADLLSEMRVKTHIALVVDEYGGVAGLVTLEDLLEEIVGEIREEHEPEEALIREDADGSWVVDAAARVDELEDALGLELEEGDFDTVGGLVVSNLGRLPGEGETLEVSGLRIEVLKADQRRIRQLRVRPRPASSEAQAGP